jgi:hypothetical protein
MLCDTKFVFINLTGTGIDTAFNANSSFCGTDLENHRGIIRFIFFAHIVGDFSLYICYAFVCNVSVYGNDLFIDECSFSGSILVLVPAQTIAQAMVNVCARFLFYSNN